MPDILYISGYFRFYMAKHEIATFAGGCFWCSEADFRKEPCVLSITSGYTGGRKKNPTYEEVCTGKIGHYEAVEIAYDPSRISYKELLSIYWSHIDPTDPNGQFVDRGSQYRTAIFYHTQDQRRIAEDSKKNLDSSGRYDKPIATEILPAAPFFPAEEYHQSFSEKNPIRYKHYRAASGRPVH